MLQEESLAQKFIKKGFWLFLFTFLTAPVTYIIRIILAHDLSPNDFGLLYGIISLIVLLSAFNDLGGTDSLNYFLPKYIIKKEYGKVKYLLRLVLKLQIISSLFIIAILFYCSDFLATHHFKDPQAVVILQIISLFFLGTNLMHICTALFSAVQNTKLQKSADFVRMISTMIFVVAIWLVDFNSLINYTWAWVAGLFVGVIFALYFFYKEYYKKYFKNIATEKDKNLRKNFFKYAIPTFLTANISLILSQIDAQLITGILGNSDQAFYSNYLSIMTIPFIILTPILSFLFPVFTELHSRNQEEKIKNLYTYMNLFLIIVAIWISFFFFQIGTTLSVVLFGENYHYSGIILQFSIPFLVFNLLNQLNFQLLAGTGRAWTRTIAFAITLPINIILNIIFIKKLGVAGSALAVGISWIPLYAMTAYATRKYFSFPKFFPILTNFVLAGIAFIGIFYLEKKFSPSVFSFFAIIVALYGILFLAGNFHLLREFFKIIKNNRS